MIILAATPNEKGSQLEALTQRLLRHRGYENCTTNVMANGAEIDVRGELPLRGLGADRRQKLICECKAHKAVVDMTQWCKFLGKVFHQEVCEEAEVAGCFVSLSGVNGHVQGNFDELSRHKQSISLLHGDDLLKLVAEIIPFVTLSEISQRSSTITDRTVSRFEPAYHEGAMYWIAVFSGGKFTLFNADGSHVDSDNGERLAPMVESELDVSSYIDIHKELRAQQRAASARVHVIATLFDRDGSIEGIDRFEHVEHFQPQELRDAAQALVDEGLLSIDEQGRCAVTTTTSDEGDLVPPQVYLTLFATAFPSSVVNTDFYQRHINRAMLKEICTIQGGLPLPEEDIDEIISLLQLSPSALAQALNPMQMIVTGREKGVHNKQFDRFHQDYFHQAALEGLRRDFRTPAFADFFHEKRGLRELESTTKLVFKSKDKVEKEAEFTERVGIGRAADSLGGGLLHIAMLKDSPQPWEQQTEQTSAESGSDSASDSSVNDDEL